MWDPNMNYGNVKRQRYLNIFIISRDEGTLKEILSRLNNVFTSKGVNCRIEVKRSLIIPNFIYIRIVPQETVNLKDLKDCVSECLNDVGKNIIWSKVEIIEVK